MMIHVKTSDTDTTYFRPEDVAFVTIRRQEDGTRMVNFKLRHEHSGTILRDEKEIWEFLNDMGIKV